jgi:hypothetical protein
MFLENLIVLIIGFCIGYRVAKAVYGGRSIRP